MFLLIFIRQTRLKTSAFFFEKIQKQPDELELEENCEVVIGGDFNVILDADLYGTGGKPKVKESCKQWICVHLLTRLIFGD